MPAQELDAIALTPPSRESYYVVAGDSIADAIAAVSEVGGGVVFLGAGVHSLATRVVVPSGVSLMGAGNGAKKAGVDATTVLCTAAGAGITFGALGTGSLSGLHGRFTIDADGIATNPMVLGRVVGATFEAIDVLNGAAGGAALLIQEAQNNAFIGFNIEDGAGDGLVLDRGTGGNLFLRCEFNGHAGRNLLFTQSAATPTLYLQPTHNTFLGCIFENHFAGSATMVKHEAGSQNALISCIVAYPDADAPVELVDVPVLAGFLSTDFRIDGCRLTANIAQATGITVANGASVRVSGGSIFLSLLNGYSIASGAWVDAADVNYTNVTNLAVGAGAADTFIRSRIRHPLEVRRTGVNDQILVGLIDGEAGQRMKLSPYQLGFGPGTGFTYDAILSRNATARFDVTGGFRFVSTAGTGVVGFTEQASDPGAVTDVGVLFAKDNGAGKTQLCVRFATGAIQVIATEP